MSLMLVDELVCQTYTMRFLSKYTYLLNSEGLRSTIIASSGNLLGSGLSALALILTSKELGPADFGLFSAMLSVMFLVSRIADVGVNLATRRMIARLDGQSETLGAYLSASTGLKLGMSVVLVVVGYVCAPAVAEHWIKTERVDLVRMAMVFGVVNMLYEYYLSVIQGFHKFTEAAVMVIIQGFMKLALVLLFISRAVMNPAQALYIFALTPAFSLINLLKYVTYIKAHFSRAFQYNELFWSSITWTGIAMIASAAADNIDILLVQRYLTSYETGLFSAAARITMFINLVGVSIVSVLSIRVAKYQDLKHLRIFLRKAHVIALVWLLGTGLLLPFSSMFLSTTVGEAYASASMPLALLLVATSVASATGPYASLFYLFDRPQYFAWSGILMTVSLVGLDLLLIPSMGITGAAIAKLISRLLVFVFTLGYAWRSYRAFVEGKKDMKRTKEL